MLWREKVRADHIMQEWTPPDVLSKYFAGGICGYDREGCPVYIVPAALIDMKGGRLAQLLSIATISL